MSNAREAFVDPVNPLGLDGIEFIEYATSKPQALGQVLEIMGFRPIARHRSREVLLYRQGEMNVIVNAHAPPHGAQSGDAPPRISAIALRVRDAAYAYQRVIQRGGWAVPTHVEVMELNIPAIHGVGSSRIYFVDRYKEFSIYDVDFVPIPTVDRNPPALAGMRWFGVVQYVGLERMEDWIEFYRELFAFDVVPADTHFGILHAGRILKSPCGKFFVQLVEPLPDLIDEQTPEQLVRVGIGVPDVPAAMVALRQRGVSFVDSRGTSNETGGAITETWLGSVWFELVHDER